MILRYWIQAARPKTLPLSVSGILVGMGIAGVQLEFFYESSDFWIIFSLAICTTLAFQIVSNFSNDYSDYLKGTDNDSRIGPERMVASGKISLNQMRIATILMSILAIVFSCLLIYFSRGYITERSQLLYIILAGLCVLAAVTYTVGKNAYGYRGLGDLMVFLFFGLVSVIGSYSLFGFDFEPIVLCFAISVGLWSTAVLNLNNLRDYHNDERSQKRTLVVKIGLKNAIYYHILLVLGGYICWMLGLISLFQLSGFIPLFLSSLPSILLFLHLRRILLIKSSELEKLNGELAVVALTTFFSCLFLFLVLRLFIYVSI